MVRTSYSRLLQGGGHHEVELALLERYKVRNLLWRRNAILQAKAIITSNDPKQSPFTVNLSGAAFAGRPSIPTAISIAGTVGNPAQATLKVTNVGRGMLSGTYSVTAGPYTVNGSTFGPLAFQQTAPITVNFTPTNKGRATRGTLTFNIAAPSTPSIRTVTLQGIGQ
jgi:hypothetical protein